MPQIQFDMFVNRHSKQDYFPGFMSLSQIQVVHMLEL